MTGDIDRSWACDSLLWDGQPMIGRRPLRADEVEVLTSRRRRWLLGLALALIAWPAMVALPLPVLPRFVLCAAAMVWAAALCHSGVQYLEEALDAAHGFVYLFGEEPEGTRVLASGSLLDGDHRVEPPWWHAGVVTAFRRRLAGHAIVPAAEAWFDAWAEPDGSGWYCAGLARLAARPLSDAERAELADQRRHAHLNSQWLLGGLPLLWVIMLAVSLIFRWPGLLAAVFVVTLPLYFVAISYHQRWERRRAELDAILADGLVHGFAVAQPNHGRPLRLELLTGGEVARIDGRAPGRVMALHLWHGAPPPPAAAELPDGAERPLTEAERGEIAEFIAHYQPDPRHMRFITSVVLAVVAMVNGPGTAAGWFLGGLGVLGLLALLITNWPTRRLRHDLDRGVVTVSWEPVGDDRRLSGAGPRPDKVRVERLPTVHAIWTWDEIPSPLRPLGFWQPLLHEGDEEDGRLLGAMAFWRGRPRPAAEPDDA